jgi:hypothetical protein
MYGRSKVQSIVGCKIRCFTSEINTFITSVYSNFCMENATRILIYLKCQREHIQILFIFSFMILFMNSLF